VLYLREGGDATLELAVGAYRVQRYHPRTGGLTPLADATGRARWSAPIPSDTEDWAFWLERK
jgi:hypothetical protein